MGMVLGKQRDNGYDCIVWGRVTKGGELRQMGEKKIPKARLSLCYEKDKFVSITSFGDCKQTGIVASMEKGDVIIAAGSYVPFYIKDGEKKEFPELKVDNMNYGFVKPLEEAAVAVAAAQGKEVSQWIEQNNDENTPFDFGADDLPY